jgi:hypothetical protein
MAGPAFTCPLAALAYAAGGAAVIGGATTGALVAANELSDDESPQAPEDPE